MSEVGEESQAIAPEQLKPSVESVVADPEPRKVESSAVQKKPEYVTVGHLYKVVFLVSILASVLSIFAYDRVYATKIVVFDLQGFLTKLRTDVIENKLTPDQYKSRLDMLEGKVLSAPKNTIIITGDVILGKNANKLDVPEK